MDLTRVVHRVPSVYLTPAGFVAGPTVVFVHWVLTRDDASRHELAPFRPCPHHCPN